MSQITFAAIFISPIFKVNEIYKGETDIKEFPLYQIIFKYIISVIFFSLNWKYGLNETINLKEMSTLILLIQIGLFGLIINSIFLMFYIYLNFQKDIYKVIQYITFLLIWSYLIIFICCLFIKIPFISNFIIVISLTILTLSPFSNYREIYLNKDYKLINIFDLWSLLFLNLALLINSIKIGFTYLLIVFLVNILISLIESCFFLFLYYFLKLVNKIPLVKNEDNVEYNNKQIDNQSNQYHPPTMNNDAITDLV